VILGTLQSKYSFADINVIEELFDFDNKLIYNLNFLEMQVLV